MANVEAIRSFFRKQCINAMGFPVSPQTSFKRKWSLMHSRFTQLQSIGYGALIGATFTACYCQEMQPISLYSIDAS